MQELRGVWYLDGDIQGVRDFDDQDDARMWAHGELLLDCHCHLTATPLPRQRPTVTATPCPPL